MESSATTPWTGPAPFWGDRWHRITLGCAALLLLAAYAPTLAFLWNAWTRLPEYSHGLLMPPVAAWLVYQRRAQFAALSPQPSLVGLLLLLPCVAGLLVGEMDFLVTIRPFTLVGALATVLWTLYGWRAVRLATPVLVVLLLMCRLPGPLERAITVPLTQYASLLATGLLHLSGIPTTLDGNLIHIPGMDRMWVADACSGIRSLISLTCLAILACIVWQRPLWMRVAVVLAAAPIAVVVNGVRIWLTGWLSVHAGPESAQGFYHNAEGFGMFAIAALLLWVFAALLDAMVRVLRS
jgi:exosortase